MADPKISGVITDVIAYLKTQNTAGKILPALTGIGEWIHRDLIPKFPYAIVTCNAEAADEEMPQEFEAELSIELHTSGGKPENMRPQLSKLVHNVRKQLILNNKRWGGPKLIFQNVRYGGWFDGGTSAGAPQAIGFCTYRVIYQENVE